MLKQYLALVASASCFAFPTVASAVPMASTHVSLQVTFVGVTSDMAGADAPFVTLGSLGGSGGAYLNGRGIQSYEGSTAINDGSTSANVKIGTTIPLDFQSTGKAQGTGESLLYYSGEVSFRMSAYSTASFLVTYSLAADASAGGQCALSCPRASAYIDVQPFGVVVHGDSLQLGVSTDPSESDIRERSGTVLLTAQNRSTIAENAFFSFSVEQFASTGLPYVAAPVPEPETWVLMALGLVAVSVRARKR